MNASAFQLPIDDVAHGVDAAGVVSARVSALLLHARLVLPAVRVGDALGPARRVGVPEVPLEAPGGNCIKIGLSGKSILGDYIFKRRGLPQDHFS